MKYTNVFLFVFAAVMMTACDTKKTETPTGAPQVAPVVSVVTAHAEDVEMRDVCTHRRTRL